MDNLTFMMLAIDTSNIMDLILNYVREIANEVVA